MKVSTAKNRLEEIGGDVPTNGAKNMIKLEQPYTVEVEMTGMADLLFHRWNCESVTEKAGARKGSKAKKTDDVESYVARLADGHIGLPGEYLRMAIVHAAKFSQDPRSPRKSAADLFKAAIVPLTEAGDLGKSEWDYLHTCRAVVQGNGINRTRPAFRKGWKTTIVLQVNLPEYITPDLLYEVIERAGRVIGVGDFRPTHGRFNITRFSHTYDVQDRAA